MQRELKELGTRVPEAAEVFRTRLANAPGFAGHAGDQDVDECLSAPCKNGAECVAPPFNKYACKCAYGFSGTHCETALVRARAI